jgi:methionine synthase II (cobalamin-independent)
VKARLSDPATKLGIVADQQTFNQGGSGGPSPRDAEPFPWQPGTATGIGSLPGGNPLEAARVVSDELPDFPHLPELPGRGPGADMIGRAAALLVDIPTEITARGWHIAERPGRDLRRARSFLSADLDALEEVFTGYEGILKLQVAGPWTLAATIEQPRSLNPALADAGLVADLAASLAEGVRTHLNDVAKRFPQATLVLQLDEPALPAVIAGQIPTASGLSRVRAPEEEFLRERLHQVITAANAASGGQPPGASRHAQVYTVTHCCGHDVPFGIIRGAGADGVSLDISQLRTGDFDKLAAAAEGGLGLLFGVPERPQGGLTAKGTADSAAEVWRKMALPPDQCARQVVITPACGLAGSSPDEAHMTLRRCREAARILRELMEG